jgi:hypothetical protein
MSRFKKKVLSEFIFQILIKKDQNKKISIDALVPDHTFCLKKRHNLLITPYLSLWDVILP